MIREVLTNLPGRLGESHLPEIVGKGMWPATITAVGALAYYGGIASGVLGGAGIVVGWMVSR